MKIISLLFWVLLYSYQLLAQRGIDPSVNINSTVLLKSDSGFSSGFMLIDSSNTYLVTSRHSFIGIQKTPYYADFYLTNNSLLITTYNQFDVNNEQYAFSIDNLLLLFNQGNLKFDSVHDVVVIRLGRNFKDGFITHYPIQRVSKNRGFPGAIPINRVLTFASLGVGQPICTVGYPKSLGLQDIPQYNFNFPLLRKGIVAGVDSLQRNIVIDCPCYKGNSGGPVFELTAFEKNGQLGTTYSLIGLVSEFIPYREDKYDENLRIKDTFIWNSGYSIVTPADYILSLIRSFQN
jgi:hypothetical protein